jgi:hypothetical protein
VADLMAECSVCTQPISDTAPICHTDAGKLARRLRDAAPLWADLEDTITRQVRIGDPTPRAGRLAPAQAARPGATDPDHQNGWPTGLPIDLAASNVGDSVRNTLTTWARLVAEHTGADPPAGMAELTRWLAGRCDWARYQTWASEWHDELWYAAGLMWRAVDRAPARRYLGPCMQPDGLTGQCPGDLYARPGADTVTCQQCGTRHSVADRKQWLDGLVLDYTYTAAEIAAAYPVVKANTIRQWAVRGQLAAHGADRHKRPLYLLGDVLALAESTNMRRKAKAA